MNWHEIDHLVFFVVRRTGADIQDLVICTQV